MKSFIFSGSCFSQAHPIDIVNKCEEPIIVDVWALNVCQYNGSATPFHLPQITVQPQTTQVLYPVYPISTNPSAHWHVAAASTTISGTTHWLQIRYNPTYCSPSMA